VAKARAQTRRANLSAAVLIQVMVRAKQARVYVDELHGIHHEPGWWKRERRRAATKMQAGRRQCKGRRRVDGVREEAAELLRTQTVAAVLIQMRVRMRDAKARVKVLQARAKAAALVAAARAAEAAAAGAAAAADAREGAVPEARRVRARIEAGAAARAAWGGAKGAFDAAVSAQADADEVAWRKRGIVKKVVECCTGSSSAPVAPR
jgi:predicted TIM-barrel fold metal-dependent hydrolase